MNVRSLFLLLLLVVALVLGLSACGVPLRLSYGQRMATAEAQGCWEGALRTPLPVTVTPLTVAATTVVNLGDPTHTTPAPSASWADRKFVHSRKRAHSDAKNLKCLPPSPTTWERGQGVRAIRGIPITYLWLTEQMFCPPLNTQRHAAVHHYAPAALYAAARGDARTVAHAVAVAVAGDGAIHVVWGVTEFPAMGLYTSTSRDRGQTWSAPHLLGSYRAVLDAVATLDNHLFVSLCHSIPSELSHTWLLKAKHNLIF